MGNRMFQLLSLTEVFLFVLSVPYEYILVQQGKNWNDARTYCQAKYIDLAIAGDSDDMVKLQNEAQKQQLTSSAWTGYYNDVNSWRWSLGNQPLGNVTDWCAGEPTYAMEACGGIKPSCWFDYFCTAAFPFVCFDDRNTGSSRYIVISTSKSFSNAQSYCRQYHTDLASVTTIEENTLIKGKVSGNAWIGLSRDTWKWVDQSTFSTFSWVTGKPGGAGTYDNCGHFFNGLVDAAPCSQIKPFFCLRDFTKKQTIRMKIKSNQDVNDSAMKATILQMIKLKLEEHGISNNTTIKWIEQPDGIVFQKLIINNDDL
ncbi:putative C-type lectin domain family 20 member A [Hemibagrus wyckioides]|uniref:putative C-type lectin domain family 20 member A n=1 Tax=Hemibagrus wyckioides TaxID=337641 RepID=UPI00266D99C7|nr:putative C-type lectin domain family 20 member A [Hemibagrus wyckioides]